MVNAQEWLDQNYPKEGRNLIANLNIREKELEGFLRLERFNSLKKLDCSYNQLTGLDLSDCKNLRRLDCSFNQLTNTDFLYSISCPQKIEILRIGENNISDTTLDVFKRFENLERLWIGTLDDERAKKEIYNRFYGSLEPLKNLAKLNQLGISHTNIEEGLEYLPTSLEKIWCYPNNGRFDTKVSKLVEALKDYQVKEGKYTWYDYQLWREINFQQSLLISQLFSDKNKNFGLCQECQKPNTGKVNTGRSIYNWCQSCNSKHFQAEFNNWTSGSSEIDKFIQKSQLEATSHRGVLEWIPYRNFKNVEYLAEGGFGKVYKAGWVDGGCIEYWDIKKNRWDREDRWNIALKILNNSQNMTVEFLQEVTCHKLVEEDNCITRCYGISRDPNTNNHIMVMEYMNGGNLREYLNRNNWLIFESKLGQLCFVASGLNLIHKQGLIHRDLHIGNILIADFSTLHITDLGLCRPANEKDHGKIYGVLPYVAPEVLKKKEHTQTSDIYSFGILAYEILTGLSPYSIYNKEANSHKESSYDLNLTLKICQGLRPNLNDLLAPQMLKNLVSQCWDADPENRPTAKELSKLLGNWYDEIIYKRDTEFTRQLQEVKNHSHNLSIKSYTYLTNPQAIYTSRLLDFKNLPEPQNSKEVNEEFYSFKDSQLIDFTKLNLKNNQKWQDIHPSFTPELTQQWQSLGFTHPQTQDWINIGLQATDYNFCAWLRNKHLTPEQVLNKGNLEQLNQEFLKEQQQAQIEIPPK